MKRPKDKILVVYSARKDGSPEPTSIKCYHGCRAPLSPFKKRTFLELTPFSAPFGLKAITLDNYHLTLCGTVTYGITTDPELMKNAAERLILLTRENIAELAKDVIIGAMRIAVNTLSIEEMQLNRDKAFATITRGIDSGLTRIGLKLINLNLTEMSDEEGYIADYWKKQMQKAIKQAKAELDNEK